MWQNAAGQLGAIPQNRARWEILTRAGYVLLQQVDLILSLCAAYFGFAELNPVMRNLLASPVQLILIKLVIPILIAWLVPGRLLLPAFAFLSLVVLWNIKEILLLLL